MLKIDIADQEDFNSETSEFINRKGMSLHLEHSLVSLSKWESKWCKPFLTNEDKTPEEILDYIECMTVTQNVRPDLYKALTTAQLNTINEYIRAPMTATRFRNLSGGNRNHEIITSELIYYWMIALNIPFECQKWHLNRLLTLIQVCNLKNQPPKKMSRSDILRKNSSLNASRKAKYGTKG